MSVRTAVKLAPVVYKYFVSDNRRQYALLEPVRMVLEGEGIAEIKGKLIDFKNHVLSLKNEGRNRLIVDIQPFAASSGYWNGPNIIFDIDDGRMEGSLVHDLVWHFSKAVKAALEVRERDVRRWSNKIFAVVWREYAKEKGLVGKGAGVKSWISASACHPAIARIWKQVRKLFLLALVVATQGCSGCLNIPDDWEVVERDNVEWERVPDKESK